MTEKTDSITAIHHTVENNEKYMPATSQTPKQQRTKNNQ